MRSLTTEIRAEPAGRKPIRTARSFTSGEYLLRLVMTPSSQEVESPGNPGRFTYANIALAAERRSSRHARLVRHLSLLPLPVGERQFQGIPQVYVSVPSQHYAASIFTSLVLCLLSRTEQACRVEPVSTKSFQAPTLINIQR